MIRQPPNTKRLFVGFSFENEHQIIFKEILKRLKDRGVRNLTKPENLHITLAFLGNIDIEKINEVEKKLNAFEFDRFQPSFNFKDLAVKINNKKVMLWARFQPNEEAISLHENLHKQLHLTPDHRFAPHVTFCRARKDQTIINKNQFQDLTVPNFKPSCVSLFESFVTKGGIKYESLENYYLKKLK